MIYRIGLHLPDITPVPMSKSVCSILMGTNYLYLNLFHVITRNQILNAYEVQIYIMFAFSSCKIEILLYHSPCILIVIMAGDLLTMMRTTMEDNSQPMTSYWFGSLNVHTVVQDIPMT